MEYLQRPRHEKGSRAGERRRTFEGRGEEREQAYVSPMSGNCFFKAATMVLRMPCCLS